MNDGLCERQVSSTLIFDGKVVHLYHDDVRLPNGEMSTREVVKHIGAVCVIPVTDDGKVIIEQQFRYPLRSIITEIPAGKLEYASEDRLDAARRELREETGLTADVWTNLGDMYPAAAYTDERITMFMAQGLHKGEQNLDYDEFLTVKEVPLKDLVEEVMEGKIPDSKTQIAILKAWKLLGGELFG